MRIASAVCSVTGATRETSALADRHAALEKGTVSRKAEDEDEVDEGDEGVDLHIIGAPLAGAEGRIAGRQYLEEAHDYDQRGLLEGDDELVDRGRQRVAHR